MSALGKPLGLRLIHVSQLGDPVVMAADDLAHHAQQLGDIVRQLPPLHHALGLRLASDFRIYTFERNLQRWPDGRFYMLDRSYHLWRGHHIAFTREELAALGVDDWNRKAVRESFSSTCAPMAADLFQHHPRRQLKHYALLVAGVAAAVSARISERCG